MDLKFINDSPLSLINFFRKSYAPSLWDDDIELGSEYFLSNLNNSLKSKKDDIKNFFHQRFLSEAEHDIILKHFRCIYEASKNNEISLIIEDDAIIFDNRVNLFMEELININNSNLVMHDFCDYPSFLDSSIASSGEQTSSFCRIKLKKAILRTLCSYAISPDVAKTLIHNFTPYSLPADFHLQKLMFELNIQGTANIPGLVVNGSIANKFKSSIRI